MTWFIGSLIVAYLAIAWRWKPGTGASAMVAAEVVALFPTNSREVFALLHHYGDFPLAVGRDNDRIRIAAVRLSKGDLAALEKSLQEAHRDWRGVLMSAGMANADWT